MRISDEVLRGYLARLDVHRRPEPNLPTLVRLHERHVQRISYHNLDIQLGRLTTVHPSLNAARLAGGGGGYCFHLNGAFAALLSALGYDVTLHRGQVKKGAEPAPGVEVPNHLAMTVRLDGEPWFVDVGLGDGLLTPLPLRPGVVHQAPFTFELSPMSHGWRFTHDPRASFTVMDFEERPAQPQEFAEPHYVLSTDPTSTFVRRFIVMSRGPGQVLSLVDCLLSRFASAGVSRRALGTFDEWRQVLAETFLLRLDDDDDLYRLWTRLWERRSDACADAEAASG